MNFKEWLLEEEGIQLWLDDERDPNDPSIQEDFGARPGMLWVKTVPDAKKVLETKKVIYISFDNDLGPKPMEEGKHLANWIESQAYKYLDTKGAEGLPKMMWTVHSQNPEGTRHIIMAMKNADKFWRQHENIQ